MNLFDLAKAQYVYALDHRFIGDAVEMKPEEAEEKNRRLEEMKLQARWRPIGELQREYAGLILQVDYGTGKVHDYQEQA
ncbi:MAG: hypothetical protein H0W99_01820 [Acidobacteria bacterium]|jgi:uncharacterized pyridoxal phosphate-containing UPF0001 family protein|nr:hypothetical protein [Acidobacteriota bacterium]